jgi:hypothetical protein
MLRGLAVISLFLVTTGSMAFASIGGQSISPSKDATGSLQFGIQFAPSSNMVAITFSVKGSDLVGSSASSIAPAQWAIFDKTNGTTMTSWGTLTNMTGLVDPTSVQAFTLAVRASEAAEVSKSLKNAVLAIAINDGSQSPAPTQLIDLGDLCAKAPEKFLNLDTFNQGCN